MNALGTTPKPSRRRWLKRIGITILVLPFLAVAAFGIEWKWTRVAGQRKLDAITARLDAEDPGWRFDDIVAAHNAKVPPDAENSALKAVEIVKRFPVDDEPDSASKAYDRAKDGRFPNEVPNADDWKQLDLKFAPWEQGISELRTWNANTPRGQLRIDYVGGSPSEISLKDTQRFRKASFALSWDSMRFAHSGDLHKALASALAGIHLVRSVDFEPQLICYLIRIACSQNSLQSVEQALAWCPKASDSVLQNAQNLIWNDADFRVKPFVRLERAYIAKAYVAEFEKELAKKSSRRLRDLREEYYTHKNLPDCVAYTLNMFDDILRIADLPPDEVFRALDAHNPPDTGIQSHFGKVIFRPVSHVIKVETRYRAKCLCTAAGIACERYRLKHNRWPASLDDLAEFGIPKGLIDPFDGQPLRFKPTENGIVVYSIGPDGIDHDGEVVTRSGMPRDVGFRLWDVQSRKVPQPPPLIFDDTEKD